MNKDGEKLDFYCHISSGGTPSRRQEAFYGGDILWSTIADIEKSDGIIVDTKEKITSEGLASIGNRIFTKDTLLLAMYGSVGKVAIAGKEMATNQAILGITPKNAKEIYIPYLKYWLMINKRKIVNKARGGILKNLSAKIVKNFKIDLPLYDDQIKIANLLTKVDSLIAKRENSITLLDELLKSTFLDMFGDTILNSKRWEVKPFKYFADIDTHMTSDFEKYKDYPHIGVRNIEKNTGKLLNYKLIKDESLTSGKYLFTPEHIIYSKIRPNLNKVALPTFHGLASADSYPILVDRDVTNKYFFTHVLRSHAFVNFILKFSLRANIPKVNRKQLNKFSCYNPPKPLQDKFATIVQQVEATKVHYQDSLDELNELFGSLSQRAFTGDLPLSKMAHVKVSEATVLDAPSISGAGDVVIKRQEVEHIKGRAKSGADDSEEEEEDISRQAIRNDFWQKVIDEKPEKIVMEGEQSKVIFDYKELNENFRKQIEKVDKIVLAVPQLREAIYDGQIALDIFLNLPLEAGYDDIKKTIMKELVLDKLSQEFDEESKSIKLVKA